MGVTSTKTANLTVIDKGIIKAQLKNQTLIGENDAIENYLAGYKLSSGHKHCLLVDERNGAKETPDAVMFNACHKVAETRIASAIVVNSKIRQIINSVKVKLAKPVTPTKIFTKEEEALQWLKNRYENFEKKTLLTINNN